MESIAAGDSNKSSIRVREKLINVHEEDIDKSRLQYLKNGTKWKEVINVHKEDITRSRMEQLKLGHHYHAQSGQIWPVTKGLNCEVSRAVW